MVEKNVADQREQRAQRLPLRETVRRSERSEGEREYACSRQNKLIENQAGRTPVRCVSVGICARVCPPSSRRSSLNEGWPCHALNPPR